MKNTFVNCFAIAKKNKGVLYWNCNSYGYSPVRDFWGEMIIDFRDEIKKSNRKYNYGKELNNEDRKSFYNVNK